ILLYAAVQLAIPLSIRHAVDSMVEGNQPGLMQAIWIFILLIGANFGFGFLQEWITARLAQRAIFNLRRSMFEHLQVVPLSILDQTQVGHLMARLQGDVNSLQEFMETSISALGDFCLLIGIVVV